MLDLSHLSALEARLHNERGRLARSKSDEEHDLRAVWVSQIEREIAGERRFLGLPEEQPEPEMTDDELLAALIA